MLEDDATGQIDLDAAATRGSVTRYMQSMTPKGGPRTQANQSYCLHRLNFAIEPDPRGGINTCDLIYLKHTL